MTVKELIERLKDYPEDYKIMMKNTLPYPSKELYRNTVVITVYDADKKIYLTDRNPWQC